MSIAKLLAKEDAETGLTVKHSKDYKFVIRRQSTPEGNQFYLLENSNRNESLSIPREIFDRFRAFLKEIDIDVQNSTLDPSIRIKRIFFKEQEYFSIHLPMDQASQIEIHESIQYSQKAGVIHLSSSALSTLLPLLYHPKLDHPNDTFDRIVKYHKLFHFSFTEGSESITSGLALRRDVLSANAAFTLELSASPLRVISVEDQLSEESTTLDDSHSIQKHYPTRAKYRTDSFSLGMAWPL